MPFLEHLRELRKRLILSTFAFLIAAIVTFIFYNTIIEILSKPIQITNSALNNKSLFINSIYEGFVMRIKVSLLGGIILSLPIHIYNIVKFIFPGLLNKEKKLIIYSLIASFFLIIFSIYYGYFKIIPFSIKFMTSSNFLPKNVGLLLNFQKGIMYIFQFLLMGLIVFQLPLVLELLLYLNIVSRKGVLKTSRFIIVGIFILSAIVTPPDVVSQLGFAFPLLILFYLTIIIAKIFRFGEK